MPYIYPLIIGGAAGVAAIAAWWSRKKEAAPKAIAPQRFLIWNEGEARAAACAAYKEGVTTRFDLALVVAKTLYPQWSWDFAAGEQPKFPRQRPTWTKILSTVDTVLATGCDG